MSFRQPDVAQEIEINVKTSKPIISPLISDMEMIALFRCTIFVQAIFFDLERRIEIAASIACRHTPLVNEK